MSEVPRLVTLRGQTRHAHMPIFFNLEFSGMTRYAGIADVSNHNISDPEARSVLRDVLYAQDVEFNAILLHIRASSGAYECCFAPTV